MNAVVEQERVHTRITHKMNMIVVQVGVLSSSSKHTWYSCLVTMSSDLDDKQVAALVISVTYINRNGKCIIRHIYIYIS